VQNFLNILQAFDRCRIAVVGDLMLDEYLWGHIERISPEAPVPILNVERHESTLGGAGNVTENLRSLGVHVAAFGVIGCDQTGEKLKSLLAAHGADVRGVLPDSSRRSTRKVRLMSLEHGQQVFRFDEESTLAISTQIEDNLVDIVRQSLANVHSFLLSDYRKGVLTERLLKLIFAAAREHGIPCVVAPKDSKPEKYRGATVLIPNEKELAELMGMKIDGDDWLNDSATLLLQKLDLQALVVTRGSEGMSLFERRQGVPSRVDVPTTARSVYDVTGAGDTAIAVFGACLAAGADFESSVRLANLAAGIKVGKRGTACVSVRELAGSIAESLSDHSHPASEPRRPLLDPPKDFSEQPARLGTERLPKV
jgi:D-beta-D-heptose 7-phosphate kinase / D-beta-D-heptose 1-phosphate adenosyltransferase